MPLPSQSTSLSSFPSNPHEPHKIEISDVSWLYQHCTSDYNRHPAHVPRCPYTQPVSRSIAPRLGPKHTWMLTPSAVRYTLQRTSTHGKPGTVLGRMTTEGVRAYLVPFQWSFTTASSLILLPSVPPPTPSTTLSTQSLKRPTPSDAHSSTGLRVSQQSCRSYDGSKSRHDAVVKPH